MRPIVRNQKPETAPTTEMKTEAGTLEGIIIRTFKDEKLIEFKVDRAGIVHAPVGRVSFGQERLQANIVTLVDAINRAKPSGAKGTYLRTLTIASTMGPGIRVDIPAVLAAAAAA